MNPSDQTSAQIKINTDSLCAHDVRLQNEATDRGCKRGHSTADYEPRTKVANVDDQDVIFDDHMSLDSDNDEVIPVIKEGNRLPNTKNENKQQQGTNSIIQPKSNIDSSESAQGQVSSTDRECTQAKEQHGCGEDIVHSSNQSHIITKGDTDHSSKPTNKTNTKSQTEMSVNKLTKEMSSCQRKILYRMGCRPFINTSFGDAVQKAYHANNLNQNWLTFRVASYNVLSQDLLHANMYLYESVDPDYLEWEYRKYRLMRDIYYVDADIVCLQEVHHEHYETFFKPQLEMKGYQGCYIKRTGSQNDGCASFFKTSVFNLDKLVPVTYYRKDVDVLNRHNVALLLLLSVKEQSHIKVCVSNTHLLFNPRRVDVRLAQMMVLLAETDSLAYRGNDMDGTPLYYPVIMCGDFNSDPHSDLCKLIRQCSLKYDCLVVGSPDKKLLDQCVGITDQCQYVSVIYWRFIEYTKTWTRLWNQVVPCTKNTTATETTEIDSHHLSSNTEESQPSPAGQQPDIPNALPVFLSDLSLISPDAALPYSSEVTEDTLVNNPISNLSKAGLPPSFQFTFNSGMIHHRFLFDSVYTHGHRYEPEVTTNHSRANITVDYIFYTSQHKHGRRNTDLSLMPQELRLLNRLQLLTDQQVSRLGGLPNSVMSSDHFIICGTFVLGLQTPCCETAQGSSSTSS